MDYEIVGRKVFILNPLSVMTDELVEILLAAEYEVYLLKDRDRALNVLQRFPDSILFVNIDSGGRDAHWERYVRSIMADEKLETVRIGILSYDPQVELAKKYLMEIGVPCGFVKLRQGTQESAKILLRTLKANEARGRRRYVRARVGQDEGTSFNVHYRGKLLQGRILDISSVGMAAQFVEVVNIPDKARLTDVQLRLRTSVVRVNAVVLTRRQDNKSIYVILFEHSVATKAKHQIRMYIHRRLQEEINRIAGE
jgi:hypothetical protein